MPKQPSLTGVCVCCQDMWVQHVTSTHLCRGHDLLCDLIKYPRLVTVYPTLVHAKRSFCEVPPQPPSAPLPDKAICPRVTSMCWLLQDLHRGILWSRMREGYNMFEPLPNNQKNPTLLFKNNIENCSLSQFIL